MVTKALIAFLWFAGTTSDSSGHQVSKVAAVVGVKRCNLLGKSRWYQTSLA
jgi:hypothetical protein